jgi:microsomal dipeptidase-like Zn-dependent dipeptidase
MGIPPVVDLHAHFPMHFDPASQDMRRTLKAARFKERLLDRIKFAILSWASTYFNRENPNDANAVTIDSLRQGNVTLALSVAYCPFDELDLGEPYASAPKDAYFQSVMRLYDIVEAAIERDGRAQVVRNINELEAARAAGRVAIIHALEGGLHAGGSNEAIVRNTAKLAERGLGYITVAHLFWRRVATNAPALPFLPDSLYRFMFSQPNKGLQARGRTLICEMVRHGILIDVTHMSEKSMDDTFALLDEIDPAGNVPVIASHIACSFGKYAYNLKQKYVEQIATRGGVCGIIYCDHYVRDGRGVRTATFDDTFARIEEQVETLRKWGGDDVLAIGSDLDGFIKPTLAGLSSAKNHKDLAARLQLRYGDVLAEKICSGNALRVFQRAWMQPPSLAGARTFA